jgi:hypothetical protein
MVSPHTPRRPTDSQHGYAIKTTTDCTITQTGQTSLTSLHATTSRLQDTTAGTTPPTTLGHLNTQSKNLRLSAMARTPGRTKSYAYECRKPRRGTQHLIPPPRRIHHRQGYDRNENRFKKPPQRPKNSAKRV